MLGYVIAEGQGRGDRLLAEAAEALRAGGWPLAGAVQVNLPRAAGPCHMDLHVLSAHRVIRISQNLGQLSRGCRLDPAALEQAVGLVEAALDAEPRPRLVIVNKFGKQEAEGRGFRPLIARALDEGFPVLTAAGPAQLPAFRAYAEGLAEPVPATLPGILKWAEGAADAAA